MVKEATQDANMEQALTKALNDKGDGIDVKVDNRLTRLEGLVDELAGTQLAEQLEFVKQQIMAQVVERDVRNMSELLTYIKDESVKEELEAMRAQAMQTRGDLSSLQNVVSKLQGRIDAFEAPEEVRLKEELHEACKRSTSDVDSNIPAARQEIANIDIANLQEMHTRLQDEIDSLRTDIRQLVTIDLNAMVKKLQEHEVLLDVEVQTRLREDESIAQTCTDMVEEIKDMLRLMISQDQPQPPDAPESEPGSKVSDRDAQRISSDVQHSAYRPDPEVLHELHGGAASSTDAETHDSIPEGARQAQMTENDDSADMVEGLRSTILGYLRSDFQDLVSETLQGLHSMPNLSSVVYPSSPADLSSPAAASMPVVGTPATLRGTGSPPKPETMHEARVPQGVSRPGTSKGGSFTVPMVTQPPVVLGSSEVNSRQLVGNRSPSALSPPRASSPHTVLRQVSNHAPSHISPSPVAQLQRQRAGTLPSSRLKIVTLGS